VPQLEINGTTYDFDEKGYLIEFGSWNRELAEELATIDEIKELTAEHWHVINYLRQFQDTKGTAPMIRIMCRESGCSLQKIYDLFPKGPAKGACRVAGLPRPDTCV
jgi:TusE/DsrC/DsvC family sulfur relay protein